MAQRHTDGPKKHRFTNDIIVLGVKPTNKYNTSCLCKACDEVLGREKSLESPITNKKNVLGSQEAVDEYCNRTDNETDKAQKASKKHKSADMSAMPISIKKPRKRVSNSKTISNFIVKDISMKDKPKFERLLLRMTISNGWAFHWITNPETKEFFEFLNPVLTFPSQYVLSNHILEAERTNYIKSREQKLKEDKIGEVQVWEAIDTSSERERMIDVIPKIKNMIKDASSLGAKLLAIVSDSAPAYSAARRRLRLQYPEIVFLPCFAHQCNLTVGEIFKESTEFKLAMKQSIKINLATKYESPFEISTYDSSDEGSNQPSNSLDELYLPQLITATLLNDNFWQSITRLHSLLLPYCGALNKLQSGTTCLYDVLQAFGGILRIKRKYSFDFATYKQFEKNALGFWEFASNSTRELGPLAIRLFGICVNAASVERLWSSMGFLHTNRRCRLHNDKVLAMSQIHQPTDGQIGLNIDMDEDNRLYNESSDITNADDWENQLRDWEQILIDEEVARQEEEEEQRDNPHDYMEGDLLNNYKHLAVDDKAKWELCSIFSVQFQKPDYMNNDK
ncbi:1596_t:CDS:2 [Scutellospora calospora]|uniref:1596_t:CDS:1 n=1 Tax=Scutellospora calospora TaxID=85575 RepID=A0ACA9KFS0_9GLOM|nr:1596_t:CDS:2 [Scutellospora calospora]